jgi:hypothetical protein
MLGAVRGSLGEVGAPDVLQLVINGQKSGRLTLAGDVDEIVVGFQSAWVVSVANTSRPLAGDLGARLVRAGLIDDTQLGMVLRERARTDEHLGTIAVRSGYARAEDIKVFATLQAMDTLQEVFTWTEGQFELDERSSSGDGSEWIEPLSAQQLMLNGLWAMDELPKLSRRFPDLSLPVAQTAPLPKLDAGPAVHPDLTDDLDTGEQAIGEPEQKIHALAAGGLSMRKLIDRARLTRLQGLHALAQLIDGGYVRVGR